MIAVGPLEQPKEAAAYSAALAAATITRCQLYASPKVLADRVAQRGRGITPTWGLAGDELAGQSPARLREIADRSTRITAALDGFGDLQVDTDDRLADEIAAQILRRTGWPSRPR